MGKKNPLQMPNTLVVKACVFFFFEFWWGLQPGLSSGRKQGMEKRLKSGGKRAEEEKGHKGRSGK